MYSTTHWINIIYWWSQHRTYTEGLCRNLDAITWNTRNDDRSNKSWLCNCPFWIILFLNSFNKWNVRLMFVVPTNALWAKQYLDIPISKKTNFLKTMTTASPFTENYTSKHSCPKNILKCPVQNFVFYLNTAKWLWPILNKSLKPSFIPGVCIYVWFNSKLPTNINESNLIPGVVSQFGFVCH